MLNRFCLVTVFIIAASVFHVSGQIQPKPTGSVTIENLVETLNERGYKVNFSVFVTLYKDGQAIRTTELPNNGNQSLVNWNDVPVGAQEIHFEAKHYGKVIKRIVVVKDGLVRVELNSMDKNDEVWGAGPSLFDLQKRIETLEIANTALKTQIASLKTELTALKERK